jgi:hypothetical protein
MQVNEEFYGGLDERKSKERKTIIRQKTVGKKKNFKQACSYLIRHN